MAIGRSGRRDYLGRVGVRARITPMDRALAATDVAEVERLVEEMHRYLYRNANNITIGEMHTNYATN